MPIGAAIGGAVIGAGGSVIAGSQAAGAQKDAAKTAADSSLAVANANNALIRETRGQNIALASPFYNSGLLAGNALTDLLFGTNTYNAHVLDKPTVPGGGTFPAGALSGTAPRTGTGTSSTARPGLGFAAQAALMAGNPNAAGAIMARRNARLGRDAPDTPPIEGGGTPTGNGNTGVVPPGTPNSTVPGTQPTSALSAFDRFREGSNYQWRLNEGSRELTSGLARGTLDSGAAQKAIVEYGQNFASNELGRYMDLLAQQQNVGLTAANAVMGVSTNATNAIAAQNTNAGNAAANAALASGQASAGMWNTVGQTAGQLGGALFQYGMGGMQPRSTTPPINYGPSSYGVGFNTSYLGTTF